MLLVPRTGQNKIFHMHSFKLPISTYFYITFTPINNLDKTLLNTFNLTTLSYKSPYINNSVLPPSPLTCFISSHPLTTTFHESSPLDPSEYGSSRMRYNPVQLITSMTE